MRLRFAVRACTRRRSTRVLGITAVLYGKSSPRYCFMIKSSALRFSSGSATVLQIAPADDAFVVDGTRPIFQNQTVGTVQLKAGAVVLFYQGILRSLPRAVDVQGHSVRLHSEVHGENVGYCVRVQRQMKHLAAGHHLRDLGGVGHFPVSSTHCASSLTVWLHISSDSSSSVPRRSRPVPENPRRRTVPASMRR